MHYYWLKKKWFYDIIVNNLLFAFILTMSPYDFDVDADIDYAEVATLDTPECEVNLLEVSQRTGLALTQDFEFELETDPFDLEVSLNPCHTYKFELEDGHLSIEVPIQIVEPSLVQTEEAKVYVIEYTKELENEIELCQVEEIIPTQEIEFINIVCPNSDVAFEVLETINFAFGEEIETLYYDFANSLQFESVNTYNFALSDLYAKIDRSVEMSIHSATFLGFSLSNVGVVSANINARFYTPTVLELKMSNIQVENLEIYNNIEVTNYVTRFSDLEGLIVEDLTGKKFRDLRNLVV